MYFNLKQLQCEFWKKILAKLSSIVVKSLYCKSYTGCLKQDSVKLCLFWCFYIPSAWWSTIKHQDWCSNPFTSIGELYFDRQTKSRSRTSWKLCPLPPLLAFECKNMCKVADFRLAHVVDWQGNAYLFLIKWQSLRWYTHRDTGDLEKLK